MAPFGRPSLLFVVKSGDCNSDTDYDGDSCKTTDVGSDGRMNSCIAADITCDGGGDSSTRGCAVCVVDSSICCNVALLVSLSDGDGILPFLLSF